MTTAIDAAMELGGFAAAHALWCVSAGETYVPSRFSQLSDGSRTIQTFMLEELTEAVAAGKQQMEVNENNAAAAVLVFDGYVTLGQSRSDALLVDIREHSGTGVSVLMAIPFTPAAPAKGLVLFQRRKRFAVHRPKFLELKGIGDEKTQELAEAFFRGVDSHEKGAACWNAHLDESR